MRRICAAAQAVRLLSRTVSLAAQIRVNCHAASLRLATPSRLTPYDFALRDVLEGRDVEVA